MVIGPSNKNVQEKAVNLAAKYVEEFAILNGYDSEIIFKLYYLHNMNHAKSYTVDKYYRSGHEPAKRNALTGRIEEEAHDWSYLTEVHYQIKFFILA